MNQPGIPVSAGIPARIACDDVHARRRGPACSVDLVKTQKGPVLANHVDDSGREPGECNIDIALVVGYLKVEASKVHDAFAIGHPHEESAAVFDDSIDYMSCRDEETRIRDLQKDATAFKDG